MINRLKAPVEKLDNIQEELGNFNRQGNDISKSNGNVRGNSQYKEEKVLQGACKYDVDS
jgi:hypothetical protein